MKSPEPLLDATVMDRLTSEVRQAFPMKIVDNRVICDEIKRGVGRKKTKR